MSSCFSVSDSDLRPVNLTTPDYCGRAYRTCLARKNVKLSSGLARRSNWRTRNLRGKTKQRGRTVSQLLKYSFIINVPFVDFGSDFALVQSVFRRTTPASPPPSKPSSHLTYPVHLPPSHTQTHLNPSTQKSGCTITRPQHSSGRISTRAPKTR